ncbi:MAG TPA: hypothetical protein VL326_36170 [Kofleriaceae bacterium]|jgi:hypothetical protein|nr:hypothetical protein [Kofleriaceae bacterium]
MTTKSTEPPETAPATAAAKRHADEAKEQRAAADESAAKAEKFAKEARAAKDHANRAANITKADADKRRGPMILIGFLTTLCLGAAFYVAFLILRDSATVAVTETTRRLEVTTLVCFLGMAFACLGFGLFLFGATGAFKGSTADDDADPERRPDGRPGVNVETTAPGLVVIICATAIIYVGINSLKPTVTSASDARGSQATTAGSGSHSAQPTSTGSAAANGSGASGSGSEPPP